ncbi:hypothetical protein PFDG_03676 [Plasmodium falciparum Dd2]|uniref:Uncharacterized protein n=1 Tax=Plasmodium falciparum (isolate Dd2) TaxID=57267 RepID=A0A0L7M3P5_PLAF4|nr:hypothetical protein PFDG_03676 [Plasmodium falciparum Dd2]
MKVLGKDEFITKFETFLVIKKELEYSRNIDKHLYNKYLINKDDNFKEIYEKCEEYKIEQILNMLKDVHITNNNS